ncbi:MAG: LD-carboxypeptidase [Lachnospiraceae bacterium]|nr:LD-carboxypeptidase [Lachnospiraceae bacterium]
MIKICVISPSAGILQFFPKRVDNGYRWLLSQNIMVDFAPFASDNDGYVSSSVSNRISDIEYALNSSDVILASIGGYNCNQLLDKINYDLFYRNVSLCGYSDISALLLAVYSKTRRIVYHGPTFVPELCEYSEPFDYTWYYFEKIVLRHELVQYHVPSYRVYEYSDWNDQEKKMVQRKKISEDISWQVVRSGTAEGIFIGGNINTLIHIIGTEYCPLEVFENALLFIEFTQYNLAEFDSYITGLRLRGVFNTIKGLIIGSFGNEGDTTKVAEMLKNNLKDYSFPIISDVDLGHTDPMITIPIGARGLLKAMEDGQIYFSVLGY